MKYVSCGNYFFLPNEIFLLGLSPGELAVYSFLKRCENRKTHQCWPSYRTIGQAVGMSENTVRKYTLCLEERGLISTEPTEITTRAGQKRNGNLLYTLRPIQEVIDEHYDRQLEQLEISAARQRTTTGQHVTACEPLCAEMVVWAGYSTLAPQSAVWGAVYRGRRHSACPFEAQMGG